MKTVRQHEVEVQAEKRFGPKFRKMEGAIKALADRLRVVEGKVGAMPIPQAEEIPAGNVLGTPKKDKK